MTKIPTWGPESTVSPWPEGREQAGRRASLRDGEKSSWRVLPTLQRQCAWGSEVHGVRHRDVQGLCTLAEPAAWLEGAAGCRGLNFGGNAGCSGSEGDKDPVGTGERGAEPSGEPAMRSVHKVTEEGVRST